MKMDSKTKKGGTSEKSIAGNKSRNLASTASGKITEKKRMKRSDIQLANIIEKMTEGFVALDAQMNYTYINQRAGELLKRKPEDLIGKNYWVEHPEDKNTSFGQAYLRALETQTPIELEDYYVPTDRWFENRIYPSPDGLSIFFNDITEHKHTEEALRRASRFHETVMYDMGEGLYTVDDNGLVTSMNSVAEKLFGWTFNELRGHKMHDMTHYKHPDGTPFPAEDCAGFQVLHNGMTLTNYEDVFIRKDGTFFDVIYSSSPLWDDGKITGLVVAFSDITKRKRGEQELAKFARQQEALYRLTDRLQHTKSLEDVFNAALDAILSALQCDSASILLFDDADVMRFVAWRGLSDDYRKATDGHSPWKPDEKNPEPIYMNDVSTSELSDSLRAVIEKEGIGSLAFIPLVFNGKLIGKFMTYFNAAHVFNESETELSLTIARQLAVGIERKRNEDALRLAREQAEESANRMTRLQKVTAALSQTLSPLQVAEIVVNQGAPALGAVNGTILLLVEDGQTLEIVHSAAPENITRPYRRFSISLKVPAADAARSGQPVWLESRQQYLERYPHLAEQITAWGQQAALAIPMIDKGHTLGVLTLSFDRIRIYTPEDQDYILTLAQQGAQALERAQAVEALRTSEERLRLATQAAQMFSWEFDIQNQTSTVANNFAESVGFSAGLIPKNNEEILQSFVHPEDARLVVEVLTKAIKDHADLRSVQFRIFNPENGQPIWLEVNGKVIFDIDDNPTRMFGVAQNITESKQTEGYIRYLNTELQAQLNEMNTLLEILPTGVWIGNHDSSEVTGNPAAYKILGFEPGINVSVTNPEPQVPTGLRLFVNGKEIAPENAPMQVVARSGEPWYGFELELLFPDGTRKAVYGSVVPLFDEQGAVRKVIASYADFTERKHAENRLALLAEISELTRKFEDSNDLMYAVAKAVGEHLQVRRCLFNETDVEKDIEIVHRDYYNSVESVAGMHNISDYSSITSAEISAGKTVVNYDSKIDVRTAQDYERSYAPNGERAYVAVPLMRDNQWVGTLWVSDDKPRQWTKEEVSLLETIAERVWIVIEKLRINATLRDSEARYRFIVENTSDGIWHIELTEPMPISLPEDEQLDWYYEHAVIRQCNLGLARMYGYDSVQEVLGRPMREVMPRENPVNLDLSRQFIRSGYRLVDAESRETNRDGRELVFLNNMVGVIEDGKLKGEWGTNRDITERKRVEDERNQLLQQEQAQRASAEQARAEAERELAERKLAEAALGEWAGAPLPQDKRSSWLRYGAALVVTLIAVLIRAAFDPLLGDALALVTIYGAVAFSVWYGGVGPALLSALVGYIAITGLIIEPRHVVTLNAQTITGFALFLFSNTVVMSLGETMRRAQHHAHQSARVAVERQRQAETQLLDKQRAEESLRQSEALYRGIARSIPGGGVYVVDKDFRYLVAEGPVTDAFGLSREMLEGNTVSDAFPEGPAEGMEARLRKNFAGETVDFETEHNGRFYWTQQAPMMNAVGSVGNAIIMTIDITERKQAEEALRRSEERFARFMQYLPGLAWIKDSDGRYIYANDAAAKAFNTPIEELYGRTDEEIFPAEVAAQFRTNDQLALMDEKGVQVTETLEHEDGVLHHSLVSKFPIPGPDDSSTLIGGTAFDITERRQAEEALRESEARLRAVFDGTYEYIGLLSPEGTLLEANRAALEFDNNTREDVIGRPFWETPWWLYTPGAAEALRDSIGRAADGEFIRYEAPLSRRSGETIIFDFSLHPIRDEQGEVVFLVPEGRNITDRKQAEGALRESEERFRALLRQATAGIVRKDAEGKFIFVNDAFCNMLGYDESELLGKTVWQFTHEDDLEENKRLFDRAMVEAIPFKLEKRLIRKDGSIIWVDVSVSPIIDAAGTPHSAVAVEVDITRRKQAEEALQQLNLQLESRVQKRTAELQVLNQSLRDEITERQKVEDALHESRNRLQILSQRLVDVQEEERRAIARELHDRVGQSLSALNINLVILDNQISTHVPSEISARLDDSMQLVSETITLVRDVMSDLRPPVLDDYGLEAALQSHVNAFRSRYTIEVQFEKPDQPIPRLGASIEMTFLRIAQEALMNVARHARAEKVTVSIKQDENMVRLIVQDNGTGIQSWPEANRPGSHGLTIMRERAEAFGGDLKVSSTPGKGTQVEASIPIGVGRQDNIQKARNE